MAQVCAPAGCVQFVRVARIDQCTGVAIPGASNGYIAECIRNILWNPVMEEGEVTNLKTDCNKICWTDTQCDDLTHYTLEFELLNPDYEIEELLTGYPLIIDGGGDTIGIKDTTDVDCNPWVGLELFETVPSDECATGFQVRRHVFPKVRFPKPMNEKEGPLRLVKFAGKTANGLTTGYGTGFFDDSPIDFSTAAADERLPHMEFFDPIDLSTLEGNCGYIPVPVPAP